MLTVTWSLYDEFYGLRPWRNYQAEFSSAYSNYLDKEYNQRRADEQKFYATPEYQKLMADVKAATDAARAQDRQIGEQIDLLDRQRAPHRWRPWLSAINFWYCGVVLNFCSSALRWFYSLSR